MTPSETSSEKIILSDFSNRQWAPTVGRYLLIGITNLTRKKLKMLLYPKEITLKHLLLDF
jgi:hypothetical protein